MALPTPMTIAPRICFREVFMLIIRPPSITVSQREILKRAISGSKAISQKCAPKECCPLIFSETGTVPTDVGAWSNIRRRLMDLLRVQLPDLEKRRGGGE